MFLTSFLILTGNMLPLSGERLRLPGDSKFLGEEDFCLEGIASGRCVVVWTGDVPSILLRRTEKISKLCVRAVA